MCNIGYTSKVNLILKSRINLINLPIGFLPFSVALHLNDCPQHTTTFCGVSINLGSRSWIESGKSKEELSIAESARLPSSVLVDFSSGCKSSSVCAKQSTEDLGLLLPSSVWLMVLLWCLTGVALSVCITVSLGFTSSESLSPPETDRESVSDSSEALLLERTITANFLKLSVFAFKSYKSLFQQTIITVQRYDYLLIAFIIAFTIWWIYHHSDNDYWKYIGF